MRLGYTTTTERGALDPLLARLADEAGRAGLRLAGVVQVNRERPGARCDMDVRVLPDGPQVRISQSLGPHARGCRLDPEGLERAVGAAQARLDTCDLLIVNKFGKAEAEGCGFRPLIGEALARGVPVIVGVGAANVGALEAFADGLGERIAPDAGALLDWARRAAEPV
ncbi:DUF2478 domain-containing protein [Jannaschia sp. Os4]|uniref:DUF2478 domain-containing protein n=1 Tax=Jannaschia sp. Os4 TaxID=2807617 RepID=UPI00193A7F87|nr:DUF2478 domain-containing protein [Jannaschia sp. Os4]MBM2577882.1 DUF2478 domain-containing protein [Jannaschia sp. Os4]